MSSKSPLTLSTLLHPFRSLHQESRLTRAREANLSVVEDGAVTPKRSSVSVTLWPSTRELTISTTIQLESRLATIQSSGS